MNPGPNQEEKLYSKSTFFNSEPNISTTKILKVKLQGGLFAFDNKKDGEGMSLSSSVGPLLWHRKGKVYTFQLCMFYLKQKIPYVYELSKSFNSKGRLFLQTLQFGQL